MATTQVCTSCSESLALNDFYHGKAECKRCVRRRTAEYQRRRKAGLAKKEPGQRRRPLASFASDSAEMAFTAEELEFIKAISGWMDRTGNRFPTWREVLQIAKGLGYLKTS